MSTVLPEGLLSISYTGNTLSPHQTRHDVRFARLWSLAQFWRISSVQKEFTKSSGTIRAENLFWRLWGDRVHRETIGEAGIAQLCTVSRSPFDPNPFDLPMPSKSRLQTLTSACHDDKTSDHEETTKPTEPVHGRGHLPVDTSVLSKIDNTNETSTPSSKVESSQVTFTTVSRPKASRSASSRSVSTRTNLNPRDRGVTMLNSGSKSKRPTLGRRTNSTSASQYTKPPKSPGVTTKQFQRDSATAIPQQNKAGIPLFKLPSPSSWEDEPLHSSKDIKNSAAQKKEAVELDIDPDFRNKFSQKIASYTNLTLPSHMRKTGSLVRFAAEPTIDLVEDASDDENVGLEIRRNNRPSLFHRHITSSVAVFDGDEEESTSPTLPRTKSQLSFMISERRATQGEDSLGVQPSLPDEASGKSKSKKVEEEIIAMAQRQGVTKAGGIQVPRQHRLDRDIESRYSSPDRDLTF